MKESDILFQKGMEMLKAGEYKRAEETFCQARSLAEKRG